jgi:hypothetical protein
MTDLSTTFTSAANTLAAELPADVKAECDRLLGDNPEPRERWSVYECALTIIRHGEQQ